MALEIRYRPAANTDIENIADYTIQRWGKQQARSYVATLRKDIESLAEFSLRYPVYESGSLDFRKMNSGHHLIVYRATDKTVEIIRILHERMDMDDVV